MKNILLLCNGGMSTSLLVTKMKAYADSIGFECSIEAKPSAFVSKKKPEVDVILIGPQIRHQLKSIKLSVDPIPVEAIDMVAYGMMDGKKVIERVIELTSS
ncbi:PTS sugar transporter subunit IIB [Erysipelothrix larvae]|uniref:PTS sugar transporter subunit IIB n=2 Tax=Erysipelothrix larvae TaxID=1514105 RepID=A0A0X8H232_9FIRM|nr:PTS sugar transporter subunit IIB [Erysipelothrix larvae]